MASSLISCVTWVARGVAKELPEKVELDPEQLRELIEDAKDDIREHEAEKAAATAHAVEVATSIGRAPRAAITPDELADELAEYDLDNYDNEEDVSLEAITGLKGVSYYSSNADDPYITVKDDEDDDSDLEDFTIRPTDNLILAGQTEDEYSRLEVYVYEEDQDNVYVHHEIILPAFPLCLEWLNYHPGEENAANMVAVGTMNPTIEIWDLDLVDAVQADITLEGAKKKKSKKTKGAVAEAGGEQGHTDAVLGLSWNARNRNLLASASADKTVKLWDIGEEKCIHTYTHHTNKVQAVKWNPAEPTVLLTGSFDRRASVFDSRNPGVVGLYSVPADVEAAIWNPCSPQYFLVSCEDGSVTCHDARTPGGNAVFTIGAHDKPATAIAMSTAVNGLLVTASADKTIKVWDVAGQTPVFVWGMQYKLGPLYGLGFSPDSPLTIAVGGGKGIVKVVDLAESAAVRKRFEDRFAFAPPRAPAAATHDDGEKMDVAEDKREEGDNEDDEREITASSAGGSASA
eukprot:Opistho-2@83470